MIDILHRYTRAVLYTSATATEIAAAVVEASNARADLSVANLRGADLNGAKTDENTALDRWTLTLVGSRHVITLAESGVQIGCHSHPITQWLAEYKEIGLESGYSAEQIDEYGELLRKAEAVAALMAPGGAA